MRCLLNAAKVLYNLVLHLDFINGIVNFPSLGLLVKERIICLQLEAIASLI